MIKLGQGLMERALLAATMVAGALTFHSTALGLIEPPGCINNQCKQIRYFYWCQIQLGAVYQYADCLPCAVGGRCNIKANNLACNPVTQEQFKNNTSVALVCDCANAPPQPAPTVEATGNYNGPWVDANRKQKTCQ